MMPAQFANDDTARATKKIADQVERLADVGDRLAEMAEQRERSEEVDRAVARS